MNWVIFKTYKYRKKICRSIWFINRLNTFWICIYPEYYGSENTQVSEVSFMKCVELTTPEVIWSDGLRLFFFLFFIWNPLKIIIVQSKVKTRVSPKNYFTVILGIEILTCIAVFVLPVADTPNIESTPADFSMSLNTSFLQTKMTKTQSPCNALIMSKNILKPILFKNYRIYSRI